MSNPTTTVRSPRRTLFTAMIPLAALVYGLGLLLRNPLVNPAALVNPADWAAFNAWIAAPSFRNGYFTLTLGLIAQLLGFWGLYLTLADSRAERLALAGLLASFVGVATNIMIHGVAVLTPSAYAEFAATLFAPNPPVAVVAGAALVQLSILGALLFGLAIWRSGRLPLWVAVVYVLHRLAFDFGGVAGFPVEASGVLFLLLSGLVLLRAGQPARPTAPAPAGAA